MPGDEVTTGVRGWRTVDLLATARGTVEVAQAGSGPAILTIHGTPGSWRQCFTLAQDLDDAFRVVAPSRPGYGRTALSVGRTYGEQADAYAAVLDALGIDRVLVVGASGAGPSSVAFAERHPDRTAGLVLACAMAPHLIAVPFSVRLLAAPVVGAAFSALSRAVARRQVRSERAIAKALARDYTPDEQRRVADDPSILDALIAFAHTHLDAPPGLAGMRNDLAQVAAAKAAGTPSLAVSAPTLVLHGTADEVCPMEHADFHTGAIADATLETYDDAGHAFFVTRRPESSGRIRAFAQQVLA